MIKTVALVCIAACVAGCSFTSEGPGVSAVTTELDADPYGYDSRDVTSIGTASFHGAGEVHWTWSFTWPWDHPETWRRPDMPNYPTEHPYPWND